MSSNSNINGIDLPGTSANHSRDSSFTTFTLNNQKNDDVLSSPTTTIAPEIPGSYEESKGKTRSLSTDDLESGIKKSAALEPMTAEQILSQKVETLPIRQLLPAFFSLALTMLMAALDLSIVSTALPRIGTHFSASNKTELVFTCYVIAFTAFQGLWGRCSNIFGRKPTVFAVIGIFVVGSVLSGFSTNINMFLGCRVITGMGAGGIFSLANIIIADLVSIRQRGRFQGMISSVFAVSALVGPVLGGVFVDRISWRWCFYIQVGLALITVPTLAVLLKLPKPTGDIWEKLGCIDWLGTLLMAITTTCLLLPTNLGGNLLAWNSPLIITMYSLVVPFAIVFLYVEAKHAKQPIVPAYLWRNRNVTTLFCINLFMGMTFYTLIFYLPIFFQIIQHETATAAGLNMIPLEAGIFIASNITGVLVSKFGKFRPYILFGTAIAVLGICLTLVLAHSPSRVVHIAALLICGLGIGPLFPCLIVAIQASVERKDLATVSALHNFFRMTGSGLGVAINGALFQNQLNRALAQASEMSGLPVEYAEIAKISAQRIMDIPLLYRGLVEDIYLESMKTVFKATIPMAALMFLLTLNMKHVRLNAKSVPSSEKASEKQDIEEL
ncbi:hypothetical protein BGZ75_006534 [Mortierella antarctica]|nr:hypothetical protein BGZ67_009487 [Mortierella alpina]KAF9989388.1 hypothetical protein BGZ75_006534 [Mortierella antarctica]